MADRFSVRAGTPIYVLLKEVDDAAYVTVNGRHFDLAVQEMTDVTGAMRNGLNQLQLVVRNKGWVTMGIQWPGGPWLGRFEIYTGGQLASSFADSGDDGPGRGEHVVANVEILANP